MVSQDTSSAPQSSAALPKDRLQTGICKRIPSAIAARRICPLYVRCIDINQCGSVDINGSFDSVLILFASIRVISGSCSVVYQHIPHPTSHILHPTFHDSQLPVPGPQQSNSPTNNSTTQLTAHGSQFSRCLPFKAESG